MLILNLLVLEAADISIYYDSTIFVGNSRSTTLVLRRLMEAAGSYSLILQKCLTIHIVNTSLLMK